MPRFRRPALLLAALASWMPTAHAQEGPTDPSAWLIGGTASIQRVRNVDNDIAATNLDLNPALGYFVAHGLAVTGNLRLARNTSQGSRITTWSIGPGVSYYFGTTPRAVYPYLSGRILWGQDRNTLSSPLPGGDIASRNNSWLWRIAGGTALMLVRNAAVTGELFYARDRKTVRGPGPEVKSTTEAYGLAVGLSIFAY